ncbi:WD repeat-containing protein 41-like [Biomphalaria glabrata]|uniref:WD repeat-containing protein 41-like n=1 Tax=Biomphalaria glabrata TaxID=6526 RepID=A0A9U8EN67_BIOGL|nr:WD repeat-containing protein 41-like [Biomphalaria glabrata]
MFQRLLNPVDRNRKDTEPCEEVEDGQPHNPYTEILVLQYHNDIVRLLLQINDKRFVSAGDDNIAVIWDVQYGRHVATLIGHTLPITSLLLLPRVEENNDSCIVTGSSDKHIRIWSAETGECLADLTVHESSIRCLLLINQEIFCAGGNSVSLWNRNGKLLDLIKNSAAEDIHLMITIKNDRLITAADRDLVVYKLNLDKMLPKLEKIDHIQSHFEAIQSLTPISSSCFATGSVDGMILLWTSSNLQQTKVLHEVPEDKSDVKRFSYNVQSLVCVQERYLFAAVGCGFYAFDIASDKGKLVIRKKTAHLSKITCLGFTCEGEILATCSEDRCMRLWGRKPSSDPWKADRAITTIERFTGLQSHELLNLAQNSVWEPSLLGECCAHGGPIQGFLDFEYESIVTCGSDNIVIIWKNSEMQKVRRNQAVQKLLLNADGIV